MDAIKTRVVWVSLIFLLTILLSACSKEEIGPSEAKIKLDIEEVFSRQVGIENLVQVSNLKVDKRNVLSEDRINFELNVGYQVDEKVVDRTIEEFWNRQRMTGSFQSPPNKDGLMLLNGVQERIQVLYVLQPGGVWRLSKIDAL